MIDIQVNGEPHRLASRTSLQELVEQLDLPDQAMALALNRAVVPRRDWGQVLLQAQDQIEIVRAIGGG